MEGKEFIFNLDEKNNLVCSDLNFEVKRGILDKSFKLYKKDACMFSARTFTMIKDWLSAKYSVKISDDENLVLYVCVCIMMFNIIFDSATNATNCNLGNIKQ